MVSRVFPRCFTNMIQTNLRCFERPAPIFWARFSPNWHCISGSLFLFIYSMVVGRNGNSIAEVMRHCEPKSPVVTSCKFIVWKLSCKLDRLSPRREETKKTAVKIVWPRWTSSLTMKWEAQEWQACLFEVESETCLLKKKKHRLVQCQAPQV